MYCIGYARRLYSQLRYASSGESCRSNACQQSSLSANGDHDRTVLSCSRATDGDAERYSHHDGQTVYLRHLRLSRVVRRELKRVSYAVTKVSTDTALERVKARHAGRWFFPQRNCCGVRVGAFCGVVRFVAAQSKDATVISSFRYEYRRFTRGYRGPLY